MNADETERRGRDRRKRIETARKVTTVVIVASAYVAVLVAAYIFGGAR